VRSERPSQTVAGAPRHPDAREVADGHASCPSSKLTTRLQRSGPRARRRSSSTSRRRARRVSCEEPVTPRRRHPPGHLEQPRVAARLDLVGHLVLHRRRRRAGPTRVAEGERRCRSRPARPCRASARSPPRSRPGNHDQVRRERHRGLRVADLADELEVALARVAAVHPLEARGSSPTGAAGESTRTTFGTSRSARMSRGVRLYGLEVVNRIRSIPRRR